MRELAAQLEQARQETETVRQKLHNAIRKGKAIDSEKKKKDVELQQLADRVLALESQLEQRSADRETFFCDF